MAKSLFSFFNLFFQDNPIDIKRESFTAKIVLALHASTAASLQIASLGPTNKNLAVEEGVEPTQLKLEASSQKKFQQDKAFTVRVLHLQIALILASLMDEELAKDFFNEEQQAIIEEILAEIKAGRIAEAIALLNSLGYNDEIKRLLKIVQEQWKKHEAAYLRCYSDLLNFQLELDELRQRRNNNIQELHKAVERFEINGEKVFTNKTELDRFLHTYNENVLKAEDELLERHKKRYPKLHEELKSSQEDLDKAMAKRRQEIIGAKKNGKTSSATNGTLLFYKDKNGKEAEETRIKELINADPDIIALKEKVQEKKQKLNTSMERCRQAVHTDIVRQMASQSKDPKVKRLLTQKENAALFVDTTKAISSEFIDINKDMKRVDGKLQNAHQEMDKLAQTVQKDVIKEIQKAQRNIAQATQEVKLDINLEVVEQKAKEVIDTNIQNTVQKLDIAEKKDEVVEEEQKLREEDQKEGLSGDESLSYDVDLDAAYEFAFDEMEKLEDKPPTKPNP